MYFPFLRGKQYELILLRENAKLIAKHKINPIIEPVRGQFSGLLRALTELTRAGARFTVIANPTVGSFSSDTDTLLNFLRDSYTDHQDLTVGFSLDHRTRFEDLALFQEFDRLAFCHLGQIEDAGVLHAVRENPSAQHQIFSDEQCGKLYRKKFKDSEGSRVLLRDGFIQRRNADYEEHEHFSDLHATFSEEGMDGFGDYMIVGREYQEGGGPAYAVVIHITYVDDDDDMHICHFKSIRNDSPADPGGKFSEALSALIEAVDKGRYPIKETSAIGELRELHARGHYPGLGYVKKLSMQHHLETMTEFLARS